MFLFVELSDAAVSIFFDVSFSVSCVEVLCVTVYDQRKLENMIGRRFRRTLSMPSAIFGIYVGGWS